MTEIMKRINIGKRLWSDERGWGINPLEIAGMLEQAPGDFHLVSMTPGAVRGNHVHPVTKEWLIVFGGRAEIVWRENKQGGARRIVTEEDAPVVFEVAAGTPHAVKNVSEHDIYLISFRDRAETDTERINLL